MVDMRPLELWGGHECTVNSVGDKIFDQSRIGGHHDRVSDLDLFADLGLKRLRYPVLWERVAPHDPLIRDWNWSDARMAKLRTLGLAPIVGLIHHGSGPSYTSLVDDGFAPGLAAHAAATADRYPWVRDWTPVNEPLTTARFAALYGLWRPHARDERLFWLALLNQIDATRLSMTEIRRRNPGARLIQTEDIGRTWSTPQLQDQANFDNNRRWMTWDLLDGRVVPGHTLWGRLSAYGFEHRLRTIAENPCPPDVIGVNHYLTSDRYLDHRVERYPPERCGGNGRQTYADVEAVRALQPGPAGLEGVLRETWARYGRVLAVTECHNGCTREEQLRWLVEAWSTARDLRSRGLSIEAVTVWALLGGHNWNLLLTAEGGVYEPGAFDVRGPQPRRTAIADLAGRLASGKELPEPAKGQGWWHRDIRLQHQAVFGAPSQCEPPPERRAKSSAMSPILITGASGTLGKAIAKACEWRGLDYVLTSRSRLSLNERGSMEEVLRDVAPWLVINAAGFVRVDDAEEEADACMAANTGGAVRLAEACAERAVQFVTFSSDLVFDGALGRPYVETDATRPLNVYGLSKQAAERQILALGACSLVVRTSAFFSPFDPHNFAAHVQRSAARGDVIAAADDLVISPTYVPDLADAVLDLAIDGETGLWHLANAGSVDWASFARAVLRATGGDPDLVQGRPAAALGYRARRPKSVPLSSERGIVMPSLVDALARYAAHL
jgi:dTDP-4-dehydrorhamnose reductase